MLVVAAAPARAQVDSAAAPWACGDRDLAGGAPFGCQLLARPTVARFPAGPLFWHLAAFPSREAAQVASRFTDVVTDAGGEVWLHRFGAEGDVPAGGTRAALVGPLALPRAAAFRVDLLYEVMPAGARTAAHAHPGPEAWWLLEGEQCVEVARSPDPARTREGEGAVGPAAGVARRVVNPGVVTRRAFAVVIRDPARPRTTAARWRATHAPCGEP
jgi:quercetin dioxygenase-like cupin family protein